MTKTPEIVEPGRHTPGPFVAGHIRNVTVEGPCRPITNPDGFPVAFIPAWEDASAEADANAFLFAAAPALLEALEAATGWLEQCREAGTYVHPAIISDARRAIALSRGEVG